MIISRKKTKTLLSYSGKNFILIRNGKISYLLRYCEFIVKFTHLVFFIMVIGLVNGCSSTNPDPTKVFQNQSATQIYRDGEQALAERDYSQAIKHFEALDALYPFTAHTEQAQLDLLYAYYQNDDTASAGAAAERFIRLYPQSAHVDYAYYMRGLAHFDQDRGWFQRIAPTDLSARDAGSMQQAFDDFGQLVRLYPSSVYAPDARQRMIYLRNMFAGHELHIAEFYFEKQAYVAAVNRTNYIVQHFQSTPQVEVALGIMVRSYRKLGLTTLADQTKSLLQLNYPNSVVLKELNTH